MRHRRIIFQYLVVLALHLAYIMEQLWGYSIIVSALDSMGKFLALNWLFYSLPLAILYFVIQKRIWAYQAGSIYAVATILIGFLHITGYVVTRRYFYGFAGVISGAVLIVTSIPLLIALRREIPALPH